MSVIALIYTYKGRERERERIRENRERERQAEREREKRGKHFDRSLLSVLSFTAVVFCSILLHTNSLSR